ncbi:MAG: hypothetical protein ACK549_00705, partial [Cyanobacteriota bacterium]
MGACAAPNTMGLPRQQPLWGWSLPQQGKEAPAVRGAATVMRLRGTRIMVRSPSSPGGAKREGSLSVAMPTRARAGQA